MTCVPRQHDSSARRLTTAETVVVGAAQRVKPDQGIRPALPSAPDAPWAVIRIDRPGTYRLAADVVAGESSVGILIAADHVTLDLAGFSVVGKAGSLSGIRVIGARTNVGIRNGSVRSCGGHGVDVADATESHVDSVRITENSGDGLRLGANSSAERVVTWSNSRDGLVAGNACTIRECTARANGGTGFSLGDGAMARDCVALGNQRHGVQAGAGALVRDCVARHNYGAGIAVGDLSAVRGSDVIQNDGASIRAGAESVVAENRCIPIAG